MNTQQGQCQCGQVRYAVDGDPFFLAVCHCTECQRQSGSAFGMSLFYPESAFKLLRGTLKKYTRSADSGNQLDCFFCPECGTRIYHGSGDGSPVIKIKPGTLDDTSWLKPVAHAWTKSKQAWVTIPEGTSTHETQP